MEYPLKPFNGMWDKMAASPDSSVYESSILRIDIGNHIPDHYFVPNNELRHRIDLNQDIINFSRPLISSFFSDISNQSIHLNLIDADGCVIFSLEDRHIGAICPGFILINRNEMIKESLNKGLIIELYSQEANENLICMPIVTRDSAVCLSIANMNGKIPEDYLKIASFIYHILYSQYHMASSFIQVTDSLLNLNHDYTLLVDENGRVTNTNSKCLDLFGIGSKELLTGIHVENLFDSYAELFEPDFRNANHYCMVFARDRWQPIDIVDRNILEYPAGKQYAFLFKKRSLAMQPGDAGDGARAFEKIIAVSPQMQKNIAITRKAARFTTTVLIEGESGTGKEMIANGIHAASGRKGPFIAINCGAIPRELLQSELFGYVEGAFTGAKKGGKAGKFKQADGGTIFLDEIGEMPEDMQVSLLRFLQDRTITPLGDNTAQHVDVRVIAATNRNLRQEVEEGTFREDLYYRLNVVNINMPPLRDRKEDIPILAEMILKDIGEQYNIPALTLSKKCNNKLLQYDWPGNVRELHNVLERAVVVTTGDEIQIEDLDMEDTPQGEKLLDLEKSTIINSLNRYDGNISATAKALGIARTTLYRKMRNFNIEVARH